MKVLLVGASGVLGRGLYNDMILKKFNVLGTYCKHSYDGLFHLDLRDKRSINRVFKFFKPEFIVSTGGLTDVDYCETHPKFAQDINVLGTLNLINKAKELKTGFLFISTDYVFDGENGPYRERDKTHPINKYGKTKLDAERLIERNLKDFLIIRTSQLYGYDSKKRNFATKIIHMLQHNKKIYAADDFYSTPTYVGNLSLAIIELIEKKKRGIFHIAGADFISRFDYVNMIADIFGLDKSQIVKAKLKDLKLKAKRPKKAGLNTSKAEAVLKIPILDCREGLSLFRESIFGGETSETY